MTKKFFKAVHKETGEAIFFGLEDIRAGRKGEKGLCIVLLTYERKIHTDSMYFENWLKDYHLQFNFKGEYYDYE